LRGSFDAALAFTFQSEGGYSNSPRDPGGETNYGISDMADGVRDGKTDLDGDGVPEVLISLMTKAQAAAKYRREYWQAVGADDLKTPLDIAAFDTAVNCGVPRTRRWLRICLDWRGLIEKRRAHYGLLVRLRPDKYGPFFRGWMNRVYALEKLCTNVEGAS